VYLDSASLTLIVSCPPGRPEGYHSRRSWIISQLALLIRNPSIPKVDAWVFSILDWLTLNGLFVITRKNEKSDLIGVSSGTFLEWCRGSHCQLQLRRIPKPPFSEDLRKECRTKLLSSVAELTGQSSSIKSGEITQTIPPRELYFECFEGTNEKASRATGVSSNGEFWIFARPGDDQKLESMSKNVYIAFPIDDEDETGNKLIDKAQETLTRLKTVRRMVAMEIILTSPYYR
jgi:DNA polymerase phi